MSLSIVSASSSSQQPRTTLSASAEVKTSVHKSSWMIRCAKAMMCRSASSPSSLMSPPSACLLSFQSFSSFSSSTPNLPMTLFALFHEAGSGGRSGISSSTFTRSGMLHYDFPLGVNVDLAGNECNALLLTSNNGGSSGECSVDVATAAVFLATWDIVDSRRFNLPFA